VTIYECDFCKEQKACRKLTMNDMEYDICASCQKKLSKKLEGRGTKRLPQSHWIYAYNVWPYWNPVYIQPVYQPTWPTITGTGSTQNDTVTVTNTNPVGTSYVINGGYVSGSCTGNTMLLSDMANQQ